MSKKTFLTFAIALFAFCLIDPAFAEGLPWESGLATLKKSLTGPVATGIALVGIVGAGAALAFGGEISGFLKSIITLVLVVSLLIGGNTLLTKVFGASEASGATITYVIQDTHVIKLA